MKGPYPHGTINEFNRGRTTALANRAAASSTPSSGLVRESSPPPPAPPPPPGWRLAPRPEPVAVYARRRETTAAPTCASSSAGSSGKAAWLRADVVLAAPDALALLRAKAPSVPSCTDARRRARTADTVGSRCAGGDRSTGRDGGDSGGDGGDNGDGGDCSRMDGCAAGTNANDIRRPVGDSTFNDDTEDGEEQRAPPPASSSNAGDVRGCSSSSAASLGPKPTVTTNRPGMSPSSPPSGSSEPA